MATPFNFYYDFNHEKPIPTNENGAPIIEYSIMPGEDKTYPIYVQNKIAFDTQLEITSDSPEVYFDKLPLTLSKGSSGKFKIIFSPKIDRIEPLVPKLKMTWMSKSD